MSVGTWILAGVRAGARARPRPSELLPARWRRPLPAGCCARWAGRPGWPRRRSRPASPPTPRCCWPQTAVPAWHEAHARAAVRVHRPARRPAAGGLGMIVAPLGGGRAGPAAGGGRRRGRAGRVPGAGAAARARRRDLPRPAAAGRTCAGPTALTAAGAPGAAPARPAGRRVAAAASGLALLAGGLFQRLGAASTPGISPPRTPSTSSSRSAAGSPNTARPGRPSSPVRSDLSDFAAAGVAAVLRCRRSVGGIRGPVPGREDRPGALSDEARTRRAARCADPADEALSRSRWRRLVCCSWPACAPVDASDAGLTAPAPSITATPTAAPTTAAPTTTAPTTAAPSTAPATAPSAGSVAPLPEAEAEAGTEAEACAEAEPGAEAGSGTVHMRPELCRPVPEGRHRGLRLLQRQRKRTQLCLRHRAGGRQRPVRARPRQRRARL